MSLYYSLGGGTVLYGMYGIMYGMYGIPYTTQNQIMILFKLLIKLYTTVLLALTFLPSSTMTDLEITGNFASVRILFGDDHPVPAYKWMPSLLVSQYDYRMPMDLYKTLFEDDTTCDKLKTGAFDIVNELFCRYIQVRSSHAAASAETQAMKKIVTESCPLAYLTL